MTLGDPFSQAPHESSTFGNRWARATNWTVEMLLKIFKDCMKTSSFHYKNNTKPADFWAIGISRLLICMSLPLLGYNDTVHCNGDNLRKASLFFKDFEL